MIRTFDTGLSLLCERGQRLLFGGLSLIFRDWRVKYSLLHFRWRGASIRESLKLPTKLGCKGSTTCRPCRTRTESLYISNDRRLIYYYSWPCIPNGFVSHMTLYLNWPCVPAGPIFQTAGYLRCAKSVTMLGTGRWYSARPELPILAPHHGFDAIDLTKETLLKYQR